MEKDVKLGCLNSKDGYITPSHYMVGKYQTIEIIRDILSPTQYTGFEIGLVIKYVTRATDENRLRNYTKAKYYLDDLINYYSKLPSSAINDVDESRIKPSYYKKNNIETIDILDDQLGKEELTGFYLGVIVKYLLRSSHKHGLEDLKKAQWYLDRAIKNLQEETNNK